MKRTFLLLLAALCGFGTTAAQDLIVRRDAARIEAKVTEVSKAAVRYKRFSNPDGPTYVLPVADIEYIRYANGETDYFKAPESAPAAAPAAPAEPAVPLTPAAPAEQPQPAPAASPQSVIAVPGGQYVLQEYAIGDYYDRDGIRGVICVLSEDRQHGLVVSLDEIYLRWSEFRKPDLRAVGADDRSDGRANMEKVAAYIAANDLSWDDFPAFKWCRELGEGWYLPSVDELLTIGHNFNGGSRMKSNRQVRSRFNDTLKEHGGDRMDRLVYYFSSTELDEKSAQTTHMGIEPPYVIEIPKNNKFLVRAVHRF